MISIGSILGGGELSDSSVYKIIGRFCRALPPDQNSDVFDINIVFHVPGSIAKPDYSGIRTGRFSAKTKKLMIQVSVPKTLLDAPELESFLQKSIIEAIAMAGKFFKKRKIQFNETDYLAIVEDMKRRLQK